MAQQIGQVPLNLGEPDESREMVSREPSTDPLDLMALPARLDDETLARVRAIAIAPVPSYVSCSREHFDKCMAILDLLPRRAEDNNKGDLRLRVYWRKLGHYPEGAFTWLADKAHDMHKWFPSIIECKEILETWPEPNRWTLRKVRAHRLLRDEVQARADDKNRELAPPLTQDDIDQLPEPLIKLGLACGALAEGDDGKVQLADDGDANRAAA